MNILILSGHLPSSGGRQAGAKVSYNIYKQLARSNRLHLLSFATQGELATKEDQDIEVFESCELIPINDWNRIRGIASHCGLPWSIAVRSSSFYRRRLKELSSRHHFDVALLDHTAMFQYVRDLEDVPIVAGIAHDVLTQLLERRGASGKWPAIASRLEFIRVRPWEASIFGQLDVVLPLNHKDERLIAALQPKAKQFVLHPWIHTFDKLPPRADGSSNAMLFWGALDRAENIDAAIRAADEILPRVRESVPSAKLYIAGNRSEDLRARFAHRSDIVITGFVNDFDALFSQVNIGLLPLRLGAGIKIKTLECMAAGLAVVTTPVGEEGVGGTSGLHYLIGNTTSEMVSHVVTLLKNPNQILQIGSRARQFIRDQYDFEKRMLEFDAYLRQQVSECGAGERGQSA